MLATPTIGSTAGSFRDERYKQGKDGDRTGKADKIYLDTDLRGFGLRLRAGSNKKAWVCRYEYGGVRQ